MSFDAMLWAVNALVGRPAEKLTLLLLAERSGTDDTAWPSIAWLSEKTELDRKTVISAIDGLEKKGLVFDTGERKGATGQVKVYGLKLSGTHNFGTIPETVQDVLTVPNLPERIPFSPANSTESGTRNLLGTSKEPINNKGTRINPNLELNIGFQQAALSVRAIDPDELQSVFDEFKDYWVSVPGSKGVKLDWLATWRNWVRRAKTSAAITTTNQYYDK